MNARTEQLSAQCMHILSSCSCIVRKVTWNRTIIRSVHAYSLFMFLYRSQSDLEPCSLNLCGTWRGEQKALLNALHRRSHTPHSNPHVRTHELSSKLLLMYVALMCYTDRLSIIAHHVRMIGQMQTRRTHDTKCLSKD
jgi:hypothetical protein